MALTITRAYTLQNKNEHFADFGLNRMRSRPMYNSGAILYNRAMSTITASEARKSFAAVIETARHEAVVVERRGEAQAVILSPAEYDRLVSAAEEVEDIAAFDAAVEEEGPNIPWEQVKADLGW